MPRGDNLKEWWKQYHAGQVELGPNHGKRGKDKPETMRNVRANDKTLTQRYFERTGRRADREMADEQQMVQMLMSLALEAADPDTAFDRLDKVRKAQSDFNSKWAPFLEQKLPAYKTEQKIEEMTLDDALEMDPVPEKLGKADEDN